MSSDIIPAPIRVRPQGGPNESESVASPGGAMSFGQGIMTMMVTESISVAIRRVGCVSRPIPELVKANRSQDTG